MCFRTTTIIIIIIVAIVLFYDFVDGGKKLTDC